MLKSYNSFADSIINLAQILKHPIVYVEIVHKDSSYNLSPDSKVPLNKEKIKTTIQINVENDTKIILKFMCLFSTKDTERWKIIVERHWEFIGLIRKAKYQLKSRDLLLYTAKTLSSSLRLEDVLKQILNNILEVIEAADAGSIYLYDDQANQLVPMVTGGLNWNYIKEIRFKPDESLTGFSFSSGKPMIFHSADDIEKAMSTIDDNNRRNFNASLPSLLGEDANPRSAMGCPLIIEGKTIGVTTIINVLTNAHFNQDDLNLLEAICNQSSLAIQRANLFQEIEIQVEELRELNQSIRNKNRQLESASKTHDTLTEMILQQKGIDDMASVISNVIGNPVVIYDEHINPMNVPNSELGFTDEMPPFLNEFKKIEKYKKPIYVSPDDYPIKYPLLLHPVIVANHTKGYLVIAQKKNDIQKLDRTIEQVSTVVAIELLKRESIYETEQRMKGEFIKDIDKDLNVEFIEKHGRYLGISDRFYYNFIAVELDQVEDASMFKDKHIIKRIQKRVEKIILQVNDCNITFNRIYGLVALVGWNKNIDDDTSVKRAYELIDRIQNEIKTHFKHYTCSYAIGRLSKNWEEMQVSYQDVSKCLDIIHEKKVPEQIMTYKEIGLSRIIMNNTKEELYQFVMDQIQPLLKYEHQNRYELIITLDEFLKNNENLKVTAETLHLHINTLHYRLKRIEEILDSSLKSDLLQIKFAWNVMDILGTKEAWLNL